jgi:hypothetical protein
MGNFRRAEVRIIGTRPLLLHSFGPESIPLTPAEKEGVPGNSPNEWRKTYLADSEGVLYVRSDYIFGALREGAKHVKKSRGSIQSAVCATMVVDPEGISLGLTVPDEPTTDPTQPVYLDIRSVRNPSTRARNVRYRLACAPGWQCSFRLTWDVLVVPGDQMREVVRLAGQLAGLGDGRSIGLGRFAVDSYQVSEV